MMKENTPRVSIGMPVFNGEAYLQEAIESILNQTFTHFELIISDNASDDKTPEICQRYAKQDDRIRYFRNDRNLGGAWNYNRVFALSSGQYFKWAAHDDVLEPTFLQSCVDVLDSNPEAALCYSRTRIINESGQVTGTVKTDINLPQRRPCDRYEEVFRRLKKVENFVCNPIFGLIRSHALGQTPLIGPYLASDQTLLAELALHGQFIEIPQYLFARRDHVKRAMKSASASERAEWFSPANRGKRLFPHWTFFREYLRGVHRVHMPWTQKLKCYRVVITSTKFRRLLKEIRFPTRFLQTTHR
jgi:glycosyltransferase involved in cell wall biosynthesis